MTSFNSPMSAADAASHRRSRRRASVKLYGIAMNERGFNTFRQIATVYLVGSLLTILALAVL